MCCPIYEAYFDDFFSADTTKGYPFSWTLGNEAHPFRLKKGGPPPPLFEPKGVGHKAKGSRTRRNSNLLKSTPHLFIL